MRLIELNPLWFCLENKGPRVGLTFECPHCKGSGLRLGIWFHEKGKESINDKYIASHWTGKVGFVWTEDGRDFDHLTITPSIDASKQGHWHGFITNGFMEEVKNEPSKSDR